MSGLFITGTGTGIGKTLITTLLVRQLVASGVMPKVIKPVLSGFDQKHANESDAGVLLSALGLPIDGHNLERISPWRFTAPLSPDMAARREGRSVPFDALCAFCLNRLTAGRGPLLIEGVGGVMVPLDASHTVLDWMAALDLPVVLVSGTYLGSISHALTSLSALSTRALSIAAIILSTSDDGAVDADEMRDTLCRFTDAPILNVPRLAIRSDGVPELDGAPDLTGLLPAIAASLSPLRP